MGAGNDIELVDAVIFVGGGFRRGIALALLRDNMDQHRAVTIVADIAQNGDQMFEIMPVNRADMIKSKLFKHRAASHIAPRMFDGAGDRAVDSLAEIGSQLLADLAHAHIGAA